MVVFLFQGIVDDVFVFGTDKTGKAEGKALEFLRERTGQNFQTPSDFQKWMDAELEGDTDEEWHWFATTVE